jgi:hypothetical protein
MVSDPAPELFAAYSATRARMASLAESLSSTDLRRTVPACPSWTVFDLMAHVVSMPAAIGRGERPPGTVTEWLQSLVEARREQTVGELTEEWLTLDGAISSILNGPGGVLFGDLAVHEHDLRGAVGTPDHGALEVDVMLPRTLAAFAAPLRAAGPSRRTHVDEPRRRTGLDPRRQSVGGGPRRQQPSHPRRDTRPLPPGRCGALPGHPRRPLAVAHHVTRRAIAPGHSSRVDRSARRTTPIPPPSRSGAG